MMMTLIERKSETWEKRPRLDHIRGDTLSWTILDEAVADDNCHYNDNGDEDKKNIVPRCSGPPFFTKEFNIWGAYLLFCAIFHYDWIINGPSLNYEHFCNQLSPYVFNPVVVCLPMLMTFWQHSYLMSGANRQKKAFLGNTQWSALISWTIERWPQRFDSLAWLAHNVQETIFLVWNVHRRIYSCVHV